MQTVSWIRVQTGNVPLTQPGVVASVHPQGAGVHAVVDGAVLQDTRKKEEEHVKANGQQKKNGWQPDKGSTGTTTPCYRSQ